METSLDSQSPRSQAWARFRIAFAAATAARLLVEELDDAAPGYFAELRTRLADADAHGFHWSENPQGDDIWDEFVPVQGPGGRGVTFVPWALIGELNEHLFPEGASEDDHLWLQRAAVILLLHSAFEEYATSLGFNRGSLPDFVLKRVPGLPATVDRPLREMDATRHLFAHSGGVVDEKYLERSPERRALAGERRPLTGTHLWEFARATWLAAILLRDAPDAAL